MKKAHCGKLSALSAIEKKYFLFPELQPQGESLGVAASSIRQLIQTGNPAFYC